ncbi:MAG: histidinol-phosphatase [Bacteroidota bacterium]
MTLNQSSTRGWPNYHGHCEYCDGQGAPEAYIQKAITVGMPKLGISSHAPVPFYTSWNMKQDHLSQYLKEISGLKEKYAKDIELLRSLEVDYLPGMMGPAHENVVNAGLDYVVGSVHFVATFPDGDHWSIDDSTDDFARGISEIFGGDLRKTVTRYFELQMEMLEDQPPHILGHMDKIRMHNRNRFFFDETEQWYVDLVRKTMKKAAEKGVVVEINTKYRKRAGLTFPSADHFQWMAENEIPVTLSSDAHAPDKLLSGFEDMVPVLKENGITRLWHYQNGNFLPVQFDKGGIA